VVSHTAQDITGKMLVSTPNKGQNSINWVHPFFLLSQYYFVRAMLKTSETTSVYRQVATPVGKVQTSFIEITYLLSIQNQLTPRSRALPLKLSDQQIVKKFSSFYGTQSFISAYTRA
jgi:hypothetical protein